MLAAQSHLSPRAVMEENRLFTEFKGALTEQYVQQELRASAGAVPHFWTSSDSRTEIDFLVEGADQVVPIEAKAEENLQAKSLKAYRERFNSRFAVRTAMTGLRVDDGLVNLPLFALPSFARVIRTDREDWRA